MDSFKKKRHFFLFTCVKKILQFLSQNVVKDDCFPSSTPFHPNERDMHLGRWRIFFWCVSQKNFCSFLKKLQSQQACCYGFVKRDSCEKLVRECANWVQKNRICSLKGGKQQTLQEKKCKSSKELCRWMNHFMLTKVQALAPVLTSQAFSKFLVILFGYNNALYWINWNID